MLPAAQPRLWPTKPDPLRIDLRGCPEQVEAPAEVDHVVPVPLDRGLPVEGAVVVEQLGPSRGPHSCVGRWSGCRDSNAGPPEPHSVTCPEGCQPPGLPCPPLVPSVPGSPPQMGSELGSNPLAHPLPAQPMGRASDGGTDGHGSRRVGHPTSPINDRHGTCSSRHRPAPGMRHRCCATTSRVGGIGRETSGRVTPHGRRRGVLRVE